MPIIFINNNVYYKNTGPFKLLIGLFVESEKRLPGELILKLPDFKYYSYVGI